MKAEVDRMFAEVEAALKNPTIAAYRAVEEWRQPRAARPVDDEEEEFDLHLTTLLERNNLDSHQRAVLEGLMRRHEQNGTDNPPLSILDVDPFSVGTLVAADGPPGGWRRGGAGRDAWRTGSARTVG